MRNVTFRTIIAKFTLKKLELNLCKIDSKRRSTDVHRLATKHIKTGSGRPKTARAADACMLLLMLLGLVVCDAFNVLSSESAYKLRFIHVRIDLQRDLSAGPKEWRKLGFVPLCRSIWDYDAVIETDGSCLWYQRS